MQQSAQHQEDASTIASGLSSTSLHELCAQTHARLRTFLDEAPQTERARQVQRQTVISLEVIGEALSKYRLDEISLSFNGGKDCLVLLILYLSALHTHFNKPSNNSTTNHTTNAEPQQSFPETIPSVYIISKHPFQAVDDFVDHSVHTYHLSLARYAKSMREAFTDYLSDHPSIKAIFVGTRRTDPHGADLTHFDPTDRGWPAFMRVHPVIDWHYAEIWAFIRELEIEYCELYDMGYTSLGGTTDTHPNPALAVRDSEDAGETGRGVGEGKFRPAYELIEDEEERLGRDWK